MTSPREVLLPLEIIAKIFQDNLDHGDAYIGALVCRRWRRALREWYHPRMLVYDGNYMDRITQLLGREVNRLYFSQEMHLVRKHGRYLTHIHFRCNNDVIRGDLNVIGELCPKLKSFHMIAPHGPLLPEAWQRLVKLCPLLEDVCVADAMDELGLRHILSGTTPRRLSLVDHAGNGEAFITHFLAVRSGGLPRLEAVFLGYCPNMRMSSVNHLLQMSPHVRYLYLPSDLIMDVRIHQYATRYCPRLEVLGFSDPYTADFMECYADGFGKRHSSPEWQTASSQQVALVAPERNIYTHLPMCHSLRTLDLGGLALTDDYLRFIVKNAPNLSDLIVNELDPTRLDLPDITEEGMPLIVFDGSDALQLTRRDPSFLTWVDPDSESGSQGDTTESGDAAVMSVSPLSPATVFQEVPHCGHRTHPVVAVLLDKELVCPHHHSPNKTLTIIGQLKSMPTFRYRVLRDVSP